MLGHPRLCICSAVVDAAHMLDGCTFVVGLPGGLPKLNAADSEAIGWLKII